MRFRPCIDIHNGKVKQIVGLSLKDNNGASVAEENYVSDRGADYYADLYRQRKLNGGHIILLNKKGTKEYEQDLVQAKEALNAYPGGMQIGGGVDASNAEQMLDMGASHVIVTSAVFKDGSINYENLKNISYVTGKERLVLDLSCRLTGDDYYIMTDRWQKFTDERLSIGLMIHIGKYCDEFLVHAVDVEGCAEGIERDVVRLLGESNNIKATYAGGINSLEDIEELELLGNGKVDFTVGSALDLFGGSLSFEELAKRYE
ncbi:MAG: phosphoribosylformimino-5-aminoimidazole carboxamide ribotide isomerase [Lachnospiraceae bacterium]|nr:phosphoribosylformimino-5-aminoimidazole carboxamide ribotide isomerase [Lachnospiraceae bacterium]